MTREISLSSLLPNTRAILLKHQQGKWELEAAHEFLNVHRSFLTQRKELCSIDRSADLRGHFQGGSHQSGVPGQAALPE